MDMTPMVDLAFLLLTFFILTLTLADPYILKVKMPEERAGKQQPVNAKQVLTIVLGEKDKIYWYQGVDNSKLKLTDFSKKGVRKILLEKNGQIEKMVVFIKPSHKSKYKNLIDMLDEIYITEIKRYFIVKETPEDEKRVAESHL